MSGHMCHSLFYTVRLEYLFDIMCWFSLMSSAQVPFSITKSHGIVQ